MLIDVLNSDNYITFNITVAQLFGLENAVYISELLNIQKKAATKKKLVDDTYFKLDRKYIFNRTTLSAEEQLQIDKALMKLNVLTKHKDDPDLISFNVLNFLAIVTGEDPEDIKKVKKEMKSSTTKAKKETQKSIMIKNLKESITCSNYELLTALREWIDSICNNPKYGWLSKTAIKNFQDTLYDYTKGDLDMALRIVQIASIQCYRDCSWAIQVYEKDKELKTKQKEYSNNTINTRLRITPQIRATTETINKNNVF